MKQLFKFVFVFILLGTVTTKADLYTATNVEMSGTGISPVEAKNNALISGEIAGFNQILTKLIGAENEVFFERPGDEEILAMVRDISILEEKKTETSYWGKMDVRFKEKAVRELLEKNNQSYLRKAPPVYWLIPVWKQGATVKTLEDENPFYQTLKAQTTLSDNFQMILPNGDINELILTEQALSDGDFSVLEQTVQQNKAERILIVEVSTSLDNTWEMKPVSYANTENLFDGLSIQGTDLFAFQEGWKQLNQKMISLWEEKNSVFENTNATYYARINLTQLTLWGKLEKELKKLGFLENLSLQGAMSGQLLVRFEYSHSLNELIKQLDKAGWSWEINDRFLGTLKRKDFNENTL